MKIALYKNTQFNFDVITADAEYYDESDEHIRISEFIDVDFPMLPNVDINSAKAKLIDKKINEALAVLENLKQQKSELLAITDMSSES